MSSEVEEDPDDGVSVFLTMAREMLAKEEFLLPYIWAQRQYRDDLYQMGSAAQLEDLFFDALGAYTMQIAPGMQFSRRQGKEPWDYSFAGVQLSHKESQTPGFTAVWQPGEGQGNRTQVHATWDFEHPITFVYMPKSTVAKWTGPLELTNDGPMERVGEVRLLNHDSVSKASLASGTVLFGELHDTTLTVEQAWPLDDWKLLNVHEVRGIVGQARLLQTDFWLDKTTKTKGLAGIPLEKVVTPVELKLASVPLMPGIYVFPMEELQGISLESNNKAHYVSQPIVRDLMANAREAGRFIQLPMWPTQFADVTPPNLYAIQRAKYEALFAARAH